MIFYSQKLNGQPASANRPPSLDGVELQSSFEPQEVPAPDNTIVEFGIPFNQPDPAVAGLVKSFALYLDGVTRIDGGR